MTTKMKARRKSAKPTTKVSPPPAQVGTAVLGLVIPELTICGVFNVTDTEANYLAKGIQTALLSRFHIDLLEAGGYLEIDEQY